MLGIVCKNSFETGISYLWYMDKLLSHSQYTNFPFNLLNFNPSDHKTAYCFMSN